MKIRKVYRVIGYAVDPQSATGAERIDMIIDVPRRRWSWKPRHVKKYMKDGGCRRVVVESCEYKFN